MSTPRPGKGTAMMIARRLARPMIAGIFISGGIDQLRNPTSKVEKAEDVAPPIARYLPYLPEDPVQLVRINGAIQVTAGTLLALGKFPRLSALALLASLAPTTAAGHRFWEEETPGAKAQQKVHFFKNLSMMGGLLLAAVDTAGDPSLAWRARHLAKASRHAARATKREAKMAAREARLAAKASAHKGSTKAIKAAGKALPVG
ncbi:DoxX family protein [Motilibacter aurantiacus]|uniref:DoxX family protein n=1 Tax=Motilibacter aurantiacus TaxID=2714955 RepID=UPI001E30000C|nr:DoxX family protein [Motilibacter aurantiacus]